jgi:hypothetical protein
MLLAASPKALPVLVRVQASLVAVLVPRPRVAVVAQHAAVLTLMAAGVVKMRWGAAVELRCSLPAALGVVAVVPLGAPLMEWVAVVAVQAPQLRAQSAGLLTAVAVAVQQVRNARLQTVAAVAQQARNARLQTVAAVVAPTAWATAAWEADPRGARFLNRLLVVAVRVNRAASCCAPAYHRERLPLVLAPLPALCSWEQGEAAVACWAAAVAEVHHRTQIAWGQALETMTSSIEDRRIRRDPIRPCHS